MNRFIAFMDKPRFTSVKFMVIIAIFIFGIGVGIYEMEKHQCVDNSHITCDGACSCDGMECGGCPHEGGECPLHMCPYHPKITLIKQVVDDRGLTSVTYTIGSDTFALDYLTKEEMEIFNPLNK